MGRRYKYCSRLYKINPCGNYGYVRAEVLRPPFHIIEVIMFNNFLKPGKGVMKNEKKKNGFFQFFYSSYLYITKIFFINFLSLPLIALFGFFMEAVKLELGISPGIAYIFNIFSMVYFSLAGILPLTCGFTYITSLLAKEEPCFFMSDLKKAVRDNFRQSIIIFTVNLFIFYLFTVSYKFYFVNGFGSGALKSGFVLLLVIYLMMNIFVGHLMVTYKLKIGDIFKKAIAFTFVNLPQNLLILALLFLIYGIAFLITTLLGYTASALLIYGFAVLIINLYAVRTVEKYKK